MIPYDASLFTGAVGVDTNKIGNFAATFGFSKKSATVSFEGVYTDESGNTCCTGVIAYSLSKYCLSKAVDGNEMQQLASATAMYGYYAKLYFTT